MQEQTTRQRALTNFFSGLGWMKLYDGFATLWQAPPDAANQPGHLVMQVTDSAGFIIHDIDTDRVVLVRQKRKPAMNTLNPQGFVLEFPAGRFDGEFSLEQLIAMEASQEVGADIRPDQVRLINDGFPLALSPGILTERMWLAYVMINNHQLEPTERIFGSDPGEQIERRFVSRAELTTMKCEDMKTFALVQWLLRNVPTTSPTT